MYVPVAFTDAAEFNATPLVVIVPAPRNEIAPVLVTAVAHPAGMVKLPYIFTVTAAL